MSNDNREMNEVPVVGVNETVNSNGYNNTMLLSLLPNLKEIHALYLVYIKVSHGSCLQFSEFRKLMAYFDYFNSLPSKNGTILDNVDYNEIDCDKRLSFLLIPKSVKFDITDSDAIDLISRSNITIKEFTDLYDVKQFKESEFKLLQSKYFSSFADKFVNADKGMEGLRLDATLATAITDVEYDGFAIKKSDRTVIPYRINVPIMFESYRYNAVVDKVLEKLFEAKFSDTRG